MNGISYATYFQMHNFYYFFPHEYVAVILLTSEVSLDTHVFLVPHILGFFICEFIRFDKLVLCEKFPKKLLGIWNTEVKMLVWCNILQRMEKNNFFTFAYCGLRTKISFYQKKRRRERSSFLCFPVAAQSTFLSLPHILMWKILASNSYLFNL